MDKKVLKKRIKSWFALVLALGMMFGSSLTVFAKTIPDIAVDTAMVVNETTLRGGDVIQTQSSGNYIKLWIDGELVRNECDNDNTNYTIPGTSDKEYLLTSFTKTVTGTAWGLNIYAYEIHLSTIAKSESKSQKKDNSPAKQTAEEAARAAEGRAELAAAVSNGFADTTDYYAAKEANKSAGEYYNNAVTDTPGIENAIPVSQGGNLVVDGVVTGMTATISKVDGVSLDEISRVQPGRILNVVSVSFPATEATINFYMPGVEAGANIVALQYIDGQWVDVPVVEVRADHVVLGAVKNGKVAFVLK